MNRRDPKSKSAKECTKPQKLIQKPVERSVETLVTLLKPWYLVLAYDGTDFAGWQRQSEVEICKSSVLYMCLM